MARGSWEGHFKAPIEGSRPWQAQTPTTLGRAGRTVLRVSVQHPSPGRRSGATPIDPFGIRIDFHRITLLVLLDHWTVAFLSSLAACVLLSKVGAFSMGCSATSRVPASGLGEMGKGLPALGSRQWNTIQILSSKSDLILLCYYKLHWKQCKNS